MNIELLSLLKAQSGRPVAASELAARLRTSFERVATDAAELAGAGFQIEAGDSGNLCYHGPCRRLCPDQIEWQLATRTIGRRIAYWQRVTSTNDVAARAAPSASNDGLVVLAEEQTAGRGRQGRNWQAPPESAILMSVLLFPPEPVRAGLLLTCLGAVAVAELLLESYRVPARIKWPNDVRIAGRKVCGVLVEDLAPRRPKRSGRPKPVAVIAKTDTAPPPARRPVILGIGINVNIAADQFPGEMAQTATSLEIVCGRPVDRSELARMLILRLDDWYGRIRSGNWKVLAQRWRELAELVGQPVRVERARDSVFGRLLDACPVQGLRLELDSGAQLTLSPGEVQSIREH